MYWFLSRLIDVLDKLSQATRHLAGKWEPENIQEIGVARSTRHDMAAEADEAFYADQYWAVLLPYLESLPRDARLLDLGCGQGRLTLRLAGRFPGGRIVGCDLSSQVVENARRYAADRGIANAEFHNQTISRFLERFEGREFDAVFMTEVSFYYPGWEETLPRMADILKPGGLLVLSCRSQYFDALCVVRDRIWESVDLLLRGRTGRIFRSPVGFTWQTGAEIGALLERHGLAVAELRGIGACSGIEGDPNALICRPSLLGEEEREKLMKLELEVGKSVPDGGRYVLAIARKPDAGKEAEP